MSPGRGCEAKMPHLLFIFHGKNQALKITPENFVQCPNKQLPNVSTIFPFNFTRFSRPWLGANLTDMGFRTYSSSRSCPNIPFNSVERHSCDNCSQLEDEDCNTPSTSGWDDGFLGEIWMDFVWTLDGPRSFFGSSAPIFDTTPWCEKMGGDWRVQLTKIVKIDISSRPPFWWKAGSKKAALHLLLPPPQYWDHHLQALDSHKPLEWAPKFWAKTRDALPNSSMHGWHWLHSCTHRRLFGDLSPEGICFYPKKFYLTMAAGILPEPNHPFWDCDLLNQGSCPAL